MSIETTKKPNIKLVLLHIELEKEVPDLAKLICSRAHTLDGVALATVVDVDADGFNVELPGKAPVRGKTSLEIVEMSFK